MSHSIIFLLSLIQIIRNAGLKLFELLAQLRPHASLCFRALFPFDQFGAFSDPGIREEFPVRLGSHGDAGVDQRATAHLRGSSENGFQYAHGHTIDMAHEFGVAEARVHEVEGNLHLRVRMFLGDFAAGEDFE